ncbi:STAS-domain containing protein [Thalassocella blandensis]|nr:STAS-domain containing protein [Thalassocella blandensis]
MAITIETQDEHEAIIPDERFDFESVGPFRSCYESLTTVKNNTVAVDFRNTRYIDSSALGMLINAKTYFSDKGIKVKLINANDQIKKIFSISRFDKKFEIL